MDTNALMMPVECGVRVFDELDRLLGEAVLVTPRAVADELEKLAAGAGEEASAASVGTDLLARCRVLDTAADYADDAVVELALDADVGADYVVTNDRSLRDRLLDHGVGVVGRRGRNTLAIREP